MMVSKLINYYDDHFKQNQLFYVISSFILLVFAKILNILVLNLHWLSLFLVNIFRYTKPRLTSFGIFVIEPGWMVGKMSPLLAKVLYVICSNLYFR